MSDKPEDTGGPEMGLLSHLFELRDRLLRVVLALGICFIVLFPFADNVWAFISEPLTRHTTSMLATGPASTFMIPLKVTLLLSVVFSAPVILYQVWAFVAPGLYKHEKRLVFPLIISSTILFYLGMAFAYFVVFPLVFGFFNRITPEGVVYQPEIGMYLDFIITIFFAFGIAFEVPVATILLVAIGATTPDALTKKRPYFIVGAFIVGMFLTPPDIISQTLLALPMCLLFEAGIIASRIFLKRKKEYAKESDAKYQSDDNISDDSSEA